MPHGLFAPSAENRPSSVAARSPCTSHPPARKAEARPPAFHPAPTAPRPDDAADGPEILPHYAGLLQCQPQPLGGGAFLATQWKRKHIGRTRSWCERAGTAAMHLPEAHVHRTARRQRCVQQHLGDIRGRAQWSTQRVLPPPARGLRPLHELGEPRRAHLCPAAAISSSAWAFSHEPPLLFARCRATGLMDNRYMAFSRSRRFTTSMTEAIVSAPLWSRTYPSPALPPDTHSATGTSRKWRVRVTMPRPKLEPHRCQEVATEGACVLRCEAQQVGPAFELLHKCWRHLLIAPLGAPTEVSLATRAAARQPRTTRMGRSAAPS